MSESSSDSVSRGESTDTPTCPNCERDRPERFCPNCGQSDRDYARSFRPVAGEILNEAFQWDSKLYRSLKLLLFRPGRLSREFSSNRRASYVSPVRLYIVASFAFFFLVSLRGSVVTPVTDLQVGPASADSLRPSDERIEGSGPADEADGERADTLEPSGERIEGSQATEGADGERAGIPRPSDRSIEAFKATLSAERKMRVADILSRDDEDDLKRMVLGIVAREDSAAMGMIERMFVLGMVDLFHDPAVGEERIIGNMPIAMFFLLPFSALLLKAFYFRKKRFFAEHLAFGIHVHTFTFVVYTVALLLPGSGPAGWLRFGLTLLPFPYFLVALRRYYEDGWIWTAVKWIGLGAIYFMVLFPAFLISMFVTV